MRHHRHSNDSDEPIVTKVQAQTIGVKVASGGRKRGSQPGFLLKSTFKRLPHLLNKNLFYMC